MWKECMLKNEKVKKVKWNKLDGIFFSFFSSSVTFATFHSPSHQICTDIWKGTAISSPNWFVNYVKKHSPISITLWLMQKNITECPQQPKIWSVFVFHMKKDSTGKQSHRSNQVNMINFCKIYFRTKIVLIAVYHTSVTELAGHNIFTRS